MSARSPSTRSFSTRLLLALAGRTSSSLSKASTEEGLSLIECLVAIVVITITVVAITPPIFLATASRIQSRRAEQANQIAQAEVDRIRTIVERGLFTLQDLPDSAGDGIDPTQVNAPTQVNTNLLLSPASCPNTTKYPQSPASPVPNNTLIPVDVDGDCKAEYAIQVFRANNCTPAELRSIPNPPAPYSFNVGVRVYSFIEGTTLPTLSNERANLAMTTGRRDQSGAGNTRKPLQTLYTKMTRSNTSNGIECAAQ